MPISINELKAGLTILLDGKIYTVVEYQHVKPGKGAAFVRIKLRNLKTARILEKTFKGDEKITDAFIQERKLEYLYRADKAYHFMDQDNFEDVNISAEVIGKNHKFLKDNILITAYSFEGEILSVALPNFIEFKIKHTEPGIKGDTAKAAYKSAIIETDAVIQVPLFVETGNTIKIDTRSGEYVGRV
ncbi:MAG: elongation factor P [Candidatus Omnitrophota bacterium]